VSVCTPASVKFICAEIPDALADRIHSEGFDLIRINAEPGSPGDICQTLSEIMSLTQSAIGNWQSSITSPWLVLDGYHFGIDYQREIRSGGCRLLLIDDYNHLPGYECDILLNQNINAVDLDYHTNSETKRLLGTTYALLRREFRNVDERHPLCFPEIGRKILVTLGGADPDNTTLRVIEALKQVNIPDLQVKVVVGSANPHLASLQQAVELLPFDLRLLTDVKDMPGLMRWADLAVSAASSTCWELCSLGVPLLSVILAENQVGLAGRLEKSGASKNMGWHYQLDMVGFAGEIRNLLNNEVLRNSLSCHALKLVDGRGSFRVVEIINGG
jgi:UDP-2,4-diacetamido-2,4,6-trideoxy-beta-L-altropyranose hydrolase